MKQRLLFLACALVALDASAADAPKNAERTFYVAGMECGSCVYMVQQSITEVKGVEDVTVMQVIDGYATVVFDPRKLTEHQLAQAVREAIPLHGMPYLATLKVKVDDFGRHAKEIEAAFERWKDVVWLEVLDRAQGEAVIHFHELKKDPKQPERRGWSLTQLDEAMKSIGARYTLMKEG